MEYCHLAKFASQRARKLRQRALRDLISNIRDDTAPKSAVDETRMIAPSFFFRIDGNGRTAR